MLFKKKRYESIEVDRRTWLHVPSGTLCSTSSGTHQVVEIQKCLLLSWNYTILKSDWIYNIDLIRISGTGPSSMIKIIQYLLASNFHLGYGSLMTVPYRNAHMVYIVNPIRIYNGVSILIVIFFFIIIIWTTWWVQLLVDYSQVLRFTSCSCISCNVFFFIMERLGL